MFILHRLGRDWKNPRYTNNPGYMSSRPELLGDEQAAAVDWSRMPVHKYSDQTMELKADPRDADVWVKTEMIDSISFERSHEREIAFAMVTHPELGAGTLLSDVEPRLIRDIMAMAMA